MATPTNGYNTYLNTHYDGMDPNTLILKLFKGVLKNLDLARQGIEENNIQKRGENLSKAIAIVSELHACLDPNMTDDSTEFIRGLYSSILIELPKVSLNNDVKIIDLTESYFLKLTEIWETTVMGKASPVETREQAAAGPVAPAGEPSVKEEAVPPAPPTPPPAPAAMPYGIAAPRGGYGGGYPPPAGARRSFTA
jgi:flagellar protein FliS